MKETTLYPDVFSKNNVTLDLNRVNFTIFTPCSEELLLNPCAMA